MEEFLKYLTTTPHNTNPQVVMTFIKQIINDEEKQKDLLTKIMKIHRSKNWEVYKSLIDGYVSNGAVAKIMTVLIDMDDSNPETCCIYADDAVSMVPGSDEWDNWFGYYPCLFKDGKEVGKLNPNDYSKFEDGSDADITSGAAGDVMICFPKMGVKIFKDEDARILSVSMTNAPNVDGFSYKAHSRGEKQTDKFYLGAYKGYSNLASLRSLSSKTPTGNKTMDDFRILARANGQGYEQSGWYQLIFRQCMYYLKYKNLDSQTTVGYGLVGVRENEPPTELMTTGVTDQNGLCYGTQNMVERMKLFGLEDFWGSIFEWIEGINTINDTINVGTTDFNDEATGYESLDTEILNDGDWISNVHGTNDLGFLVKEIDGSETTYYTDGGSVGAGSLAYFGGSWDGEPYAGVAYLGVDAPVDGAGPGIGARLMYL